jgi:hypothetical protein
VKVGITSAFRGQKRWLEQGARAVADLGEFKDAYEARELESKLSGAGFTETIRRDKKRKLLSSSFDFATAQDELQKLLDTHSLEGKIIDLSERYQSTLVDDPTDVTKNIPVQISGTVIAQIGDILITSQNDSQFMLGLKDLVGYEIEVSSREIELVAEQKQASLF